MSKIKLNLSSGISVEKPLINAFKANNESYIIFDNEMNGSMGLPIILVCKIVDNRIIKITDQNEWGTAKEYLKQIIAGNKLENIAVPNEMSADDIYYTQLTLPIPSFDALKNAYVVEQQTAAVNNTVNEVVEPVVPMMDSFEAKSAIEPVVNTNINNGPVPTVPPVEEVAPVQSEPVIPQVETPSFVQDTPVQPEPTIEEPTVNNESFNTVSNIEMPTFEMPSAPVPPVPPVVEEPVVTSEPIKVEEVAENGSMFESQKEAFMQACENMFDALVQKFERQLQENKKN